MAATDLSIYVKVKPSLASERQCRSVIQNLGSQTFTFYIAKNNLSRELGQYITAATRPVHVKLSIKISALHCSLC